MSIEINHFLEIDIHNRIAVEHEKSFGKKMFELFDRSRRSQRDLFYDMLYLDSKFRSITEIIDNDLSEMSGKDDDIVQSISFGQFNLPLQYRFTGNLCHRLRNIC